MNAGGWALAIAIFAVACLLVGMPQLLCAIGPLFVVMIVAAGLYAMSGGPPRDLI